jgi:hypothetical protein
MWKKWLVVCPLIKYDMINKIKRLFIIDNLMLQFDNINFHFLGKDFCFYRCKISKIFLSCLSVICLNGLS